MGRYGCDRREGGKYKYPKMQNKFGPDFYQLEEIYELLNFHYVEDDGAMFRFSYSVSFLNWYIR